MKSDIFKNTQDATIQNMPCIACGDLTKKSDTVFVSYKAYLQITSILKIATDANINIPDDTFHLPFYVCRGCLRGAINRKNAFGYELDI